MRTIRVGDKVRSYHNAQIFGTIVEIVDVPATTWLMEGTQTTERHCTIRLANGKLLRSKVSDVYIEEWP